MKKFERNGKENGKSAWLVKQSFVGRHITVASIVFDGSDWCLCTHGKSGIRTDRFATLREAKEEALKI
ncbi:hypothetical protein [Tepidimonas charontis]|uniref:AP2 domain protein n=1 Tax=Tepidimonas charontis TaxID=2267262 RepID=A0A554XI39_9BURK|nr:hypothetical protein [Tepidimonas charontis]TSE35492.1 hypothetical protein Tchar_00688 [Tepidimonas charontis]